MVVRTEAAEPRGREVRAEAERLHFEPRNGLQIARHEGDVRRLLLRESLRGPRYLERPESDRKSTGKRPESDRKGAVRGREGEPSSAENRMKRWTRLGGTEQSNRGKIDGDSFGHLEEIYDSRQHNEPIPRGVAIGHCVAGHCVHALLQLRVDGLLGQPRVQKRAGSHLRAHSNGEKLR